MVMVEGLVKMTFMLPNVLHYHDDKNTEKKRITSIVPLMETNLLQFIKYHFELSHHESYCYENVALFPQMQQWAGHAPRHAQIGNQSCDQSI